jgi:predicted amidohydrolase
VAFPRVEHLRVLAAARAIENQSYLILANRVGSDERVSFCGISAIIDPNGVVVASASADREELLQVGLSPEQIDSIRQQMPIFAHRRKGLLAESPSIVFYPAKCYSIPAGK